MALVCAVDPGVSRVGVCAALLAEDVLSTSSRWTEQLRVEHIQSCFTVSLPELVDRCESRVYGCCSLDHSKEILDAFNHLVERFDVFSRATTIVIEHQPPQGHVTLQNLFLQRYGRDKVKLINPCRRNWYFGWHRIDRIERKRALTELVLHKWWPHLAHGCYFYEGHWAHVPDPAPSAWERKHEELVWKRIECSQSPADAIVRTAHDRADALLLIVYWLDEQSAPRIALQSTGSADVHTPDTPHAFLRAAETWTRKQRLQKPRRLQVVSRFFPFQAQPNSDVLVDA